MTRRTLLPLALLAPLTGCAGSRATSVPATAPAPAAAPAPTAAVAVPEGAVFQDQGGYVVVEMESLPSSGDGVWVKENDPGLAPASGDGYIRSTVETRKQDKGVLQIRVNLATAGAWSLRLRGRHDHPRSDLENDIFLRIDDGPWMKFWVPPPTGAWSWSGNAHTLDKDHHDKTVIAGDLSAGPHTITVTARSINAKLDKLALFLAPHEATATALATPQSPAVAPAQVARK